MSSMFLMRLAFDLIAAGLLLLGLAYWWLGNTVHELVGTGMFLLIIVHNVFNRRWYGRVSKEKRPVRGLFNIGITLLLLIAMLALLVTSVLISNTLSGFMSAYGGFTVRQIHTLAAYWVLVIVSIHLGLRWPMIMGLARNLFGISKSSAVRTVVLRAAAVVIAIHGVWSSFELGLGTKLAMQVTLDWWNFEESVLGFFVHCIAIAGLYMSLTYYADEMDPAPKERDLIDRAQDGDPARAEDGHAFRPFDGGQRSTGYRINRKWASSHCRPPPWRSPCSCCRPARRRKRPRPPWRMTGPVRAKCRWRAEPRRFLCPPTAASGTS